MKLFRPLSLLIVTWLTVGSCPAYAEPFGPADNPAFQFLRGKVFHCENRLPNDNYEQGYITLHYQIAFGGAGETSINGRERLSLSLDVGSFVLESEFTGHAFKDGSIVSLYVDDFQVSRADDLPNGAQWDTGGHLQFWIQPDGQGAFQLAGQAIGSNGERAQLIGCAPE